MTELDLLMLFDVIGHLQRPVSFFITQSDKGGRGLPWDPGPHSWPTWPLLPSGPCTCYYPQVCSPFGNILGNIHTYTIWEHTYFFTKYVHLLSKKLLTKNHLREKTIIFPLMTSGAKTIDLRSILREKRHRSMRRATQCFF